MARPVKQGIDYFPLDVRLDSDDKLQMIIGEFGYKGEMIFTKLLSWIYDHNGYFIEWSEMEQLKFANRVAYIGGAQVNLVNEIVARCIKWGLFDLAVFESLQVLTSVRIQKTWLEATRKRSGRIIDKNIWLLEVTDGIKAEETIKKAEETTQSKVKKSKVKKSKVNGKRPIGLVVSGETTQSVRLELKSKYKKLVENLSGKTNKEVWNGIKEFIHQDQPDFVDPYVEAWNLFADSYKLSRVQDITDSRRKKFGTRVQEKSFDFFKVLEKIKSSSHLKGDNARGWKVTFDWILENDKNYLKILEENYN